MTEIVYTILAIIGLLLFASVIIAGAFTLFGILTFMIFGKRIRRREDEIDRMLRSECIRRNKHDRHRA